MVRRSVVVGGDAAKVLGCCVFGAVPQLVDLAFGKRVTVAVLGFCAVAGVDVGVVGLAAAGHGDVGHRPAGAFADDGVGGVGGDALGRMHRNCVAQGDVLGEVVGVEDDAGVVGKALSGNPIRVWVDGGDAPAVAVADLISRIRLPTGRPGVHGDGGVIVPADDEIPYSNLLAACRFGGRAVGGRCRVGVG
jgi:hypothetical protein